MGQGGAVAEPSLLGEVEGHYVVELDPMLEPIIDQVLAATRTRALLLSEAVEAGDAELARETGHTLRGSHGIRRVNEIGRAVEDAARAGDLDLVAARARELLDFLENMEIRYR